MTQAHAVPPHLLAFWRNVESLIQTLFSVFGGPACVAQRHSLLRDDHRLLVRWLRAAEAFLRRLILIEAAETDVIFKAACKVKKLRSSRLEPALDVGNPERWRVSFRMSLAESAPSSPWRGDGRRVHDALPLAKRFEALLRVFNNPAAIISRFARKLKRNALSVSPRLFSEKVHPETGVQERFDEAGLVLEGVIKERADSS